MPVAGACAPEFDTNRLYAVLFDSVKATLAFCFGHQVLVVSRPCKFPPTRMGTGFSLVPAGVQSPENRQIRI